METLNLDNYKTEDNNNIVTITDVTTTITKTTITITATTSIIITTKIN